VVTRSDHRGLHADTPSLLTACGTPDDSGVTVATTLVCFLPFARARWTWKHAARSRSRIQINAAVWHANPMLARPLPHPTSPGLSRLRGRSPFDAAKARWSTSFLPSAPTKMPIRTPGPECFALLPGHGHAQGRLKRESDSRAGPEPTGQSISKRSVEICRGTAECR